MGTEEMRQSTLLVMSGPLGRHVLAQRRTMQSLHADGLTTSPDPLTATLTEAGRVEAGRIAESMR